MPYFSYTQIHLGPFTLYTWGLFLGLAFFFAGWLILKESKRQGIEQKKIFWLIIFVILGGILGSRLAYIFQFPCYYFSHLSEIFNFSAGGLMFYGGLFGALLFGWLYVKKSKLNFWQIADILAPAIALGIFIGRIGCSLINDHQGALTDLPWGILWPDGVLRHPVAGYLALNGLIIFFGLWFLKNKLKKPGQLFIIFLLWYSASRFLLDFTRVADTSLADPHFLGLFISQWLSLIVFGTGVFLLRGRSFETRS